MGFTRSLFRRRVTITVAFIVAFFNPLISVPQSTKAEEQIAIPIEFTFSGSGYGHGVGMSQVGAFGQALEGKSAVEILKYYYPGTELTHHLGKA